MGKVEESSIENIERKKEHNVVALKHNDQISKNDFENGLKIRDTTAAPYQLF